MNRTWHLVAQRLAPCVIAAVCVACSANVDGEKTGSDAAVGDAADSASSDAARCPVTQPTGECEGTLNCTYGTETCCGKTHPSTLCGCSGGKWSCFGSDACYAPVCDAG